LTKWYAKRRQVAVVVRGLQVRTTPNNMELTNDPNRDLSVPNARSQVVTLNSKVVALNNKHAPRVVSLVLAAATSVSGAGLAGCEMFVGDFVERAEQQPNTTDPEECARARLCRGSQVVTCTLVNGVAMFDPVDECGASELCDRELAACLVCAPDTYQCVGDSLQRCDPAGSAWTETRKCAEEGSKCDPDSHQCEACLIGDSKCDVVDGLHSRSQCQANSDGRTWVVTACGSRPCQKPEGRAAFCETCDLPGDKGCVDRQDGEPSNTVRQCSVDRVWISTPCTEGICRDGECVLQ
jgi:hypothetical protein